MSNVTAQQIAMTVVVGSIPKASGTFTFYRSLRSGLAEHNVDVRCVSVGPDESTLCEPSFADEGCILLATSEHDMKKQSQIFVNWCAENQVNIVIALNSPAILSALPHLPERTRLVSRCATVFDHGYRISLSAIERLSRIIAVNPRQIEDLATRYDVSADLITLIPNGTDISRFAPSAGFSRGQGEVLRLGYLGRIHEQKGALFLTDIIRHLDAEDIPFTLSIAGEGVHETTLKREMAGYISDGQVVFSGTVLPDDVPEFFAGIDVFLFPSLFEGSPNALLESMAAGCVPVAWNLAGITDHIIEDGVSGVLAREGNCKEVSDRVVVLHKDKGRLKKMAGSAVVVAASKFSKERMIKDYLQVFRMALASPPVPAVVRPWRDFQVDQAFRQPYWRSFIPRPLIKWVKDTLFLLKLSNRQD